MSSEIQTSDWMVIHKVLEAARAENEQFKAIVAEIAALEVPVKQPFVPFNHEYKGVVTGSQAFHILMRLQKLGEV